MDTSLRTVWHVCHPGCEHRPSLYLPRLDAHAAQPGRDLYGTPLADDLGDGRLGAPDPRRRVLLRGGTILSMDDRIGDFARGDILIEGSRIAAVAGSIDADDTTVIDATDKILIPGFCDPHIHSWEGSLGRLIPNNASTVAEDTGQPEAHPHGTRSYMHVLHNVFAPAYQPDDIYIGTLATLLAALNGGITTVCDNMHNARSQAHSDAAILAMIDSGVRGVHAFGRPRFGEWDRQFPEDAYRLSKTFFTSRDQLQTLRLYMLGRDPIEEINEVLKVRRDLDLWITFDSGIGLQPVAQLYADGRFDGRETINHGNFVPLDKRRVLAEHGAQVNVCPRIESQFRFGSIPWQDWLDVGLQPAMSNDNPATYAVSMFAEMQTMYAFQRAKMHRERIEGSECVASLVTLRDMLRSSTLRGAQNCGLGDRTGSLSPGKQADIVMIDTANIQLFPPGNAVCSVVQGADIGSVDAVFIGGRLRKWHGRLAGVDFTGLRRMIDGSRQRLLETVRWPLSRIDFTD